MVAAQDSCCHAQHTYAHLQLVLKALARQPNGAAFEFLSQVGPFPVRT